MSWMNMVPTVLQRLFDGARWKNVCLALAAIACLSATGCQTPGLFSRDVSDDETTRRMASIEGTRGPLERLLHRKKSEEAKDDHSVASAEGQAELDRAKKLSDAGEYKKAEKAYKSIAKHYKDSPVAEDALFFRAESLYKRKSYSWAQDGYDELLKEFPSTRHLDQVTRRMFTIAQVW